MVHGDRSRIQYLRCLSTLGSLFASSENIKGDSDTHYALSVPARTKPRGSTSKNLDMMSLYVCQVPVVLTILKRRMFCLTMT